MTMCAYCDHTMAEHVGVRCWGEVRAFPSGWRGCSCVEFQYDEDLRPVLEVVVETESPPPDVPMQSGWGG